jgi:putative NIF3 family GTP cyclohydrolase 1 type 2
MTSEVVELLDKEFRVQEVGDPFLARYALEEVGRAYATEAFLSERSGLVFDFADDVEEVYCVVFTTPEVLDYLLQVTDAPSLVFTHHPHDYREDARGFGPFPEDYLAEFKRREIAVYAIHTPLDVGLNISVSRSLAHRLSLSSQVPFSETRGGHVGMIGSLETEDLDAMADHVSRALYIDTVDVFDNGAVDGTVAVVAGGGDQPEILKEAHELGCTTYVTGTVVHRWQMESIQELNREFHALARRLEVNLIGATHYHTEKCGVQDVAAYLRQNDIEATFLEDPLLENYEMGNWMPLDR